MTITFAQFAWGFALLVAWTGLLVGIIRWLLNRQIAVFETKLTEAYTKAASAITAQENHEKAMLKELSTIRQEFAQKAVCSNHQRMEDDNREQFQRLAKMTGGIERMNGKLDGIINSIDLLMQHHIKGGN